MARTDKKATEQQREQAAASAVVATPAQQAGEAEAQTNAVARVRGMLEARGDELAAGLRAFGIDPERFKSVALSQFSRRPELWSCDPLSVYRAMKEAADYGLEPTGAIGGAHLVPYGQQAQLLIDYRGLVRMIRRSGEVVRVEARVVRQQDHFVYRYGLEPTLEHVPALVPDPGDLAYVYAVLIFRDGDRQFDVMSKAEVEAIRGRSRAGRSGPWVTDYFEMAKKTVLRRLCKLAPLDDLTRTALAREDEREGSASGPVHVGTVLGTDRNAQLRGQLADRLAPQISAGVTGQVFADALAGAADPTRTATGEPTSPPPAEPTTDVAGRPVSSEDHHEAEQAEAEQGAAVVPGQLELEPSTPVDSPVEQPQRAAPAPRQSVDTTPRARPACGATVSAPSGTTYTCSLAPGHRGEHTDGQHDWPSK